ncbi:MAG: chromosomal replication initiator protein DnaA [Candidatus Omnitrophica bacterium]|nr:chromosomal replication initiator protein DnaA [Candidatus Omnitrophota bacterium]MBU4303018.1 chromosomal replication initiator protein DnaA [Candidatus Omnitrophota bacterium]MBU4467277.1 chromosomal replication initiator protein DnaA [Candidatus Omnitrophota bacterium]MCG2707397.1 chromosomal replication initiator protein DnaA [Candidatus Omnitrophota bacterium]
MLELAKNWEAALSDLKIKLGETTYATWIVPLKFSARDNQSIDLEAPDQFFKDWVEKHYLGIIQETLKLKGLDKLLVKLVVNSTPGNPAILNTPPEASIKSLPGAGFINLNSRYTFENFVVGGANRHAHAYSLAVANAPAKTYNPLFIYGGVGLGKTHLIQAICHQIKNCSSPGVKICYVSSEKFTNELIDAIVHRSTSAFRQKYRNLDVLVIDDIHFIAGKESTQEEFFHTFNTLYDAHKQIVFSSDRPPKEITNLQERLVSRFGWGLATDIQPPDLETRVAILKKKIEREPVNVPDEVIFFIAQSIKTNIRELEGALIRTIAYSLLEEAPVTLQLTKEVLKDLVKEPTKLITVDFIQRCVVEEFGISLQDLKTKRRNKQVVFPRQIAMYLSRELTELSLPEIGELFNGKDHTTVLHSYKKIKESICNNPELKERVEKVIKVIKQ